MKKFIILASLILSTSSAFAHGGGLNSQGCHNKTSDGTYHCHRSQNDTNSQSQSKTNSTKEGHTYCVIPNNRNYNFHYSVTETGFFMIDKFGVSSWVPLTGKNNVGSYIKKNTSTVLEIVNDKKKRKMIFNKRTKQVFVEWVTFWGVNMDTYGNCSK